MISDEQLELLLAGERVSGVKFLVVQELLQARQEIAAHRWIPVGERLPKDGDEIVFALLKTNVIWQLSYCDYWFSPEDENGDELNVDVTHWMHRPLPPKEEQ